MIIPGQIESHPELYIPHALRRPTMHATSPHFRGPPIVPIWRHETRQRRVEFCRKALLFLRYFVLHLVRSLRYSNCFRFSFAKPPVLQNIPLPRRQNSDFVAFLHLATRLPFRKEPPLLVRRPSARSYPLPSPLPAASVRRSRRWLLRVECERASSPRHRPVLSPSCPHRLSAPVRTMCDSRTGGWSLPCVMSD
jgi:hypothetical protein